MTKAHNKMTILNLMHQFDKKLTLQNTKPTIISCSHQTSHIKYRFN